MKAKIYLLGTASGIPTWNRYCESVVIEVGDNMYLLDAGEPCSASMIRRGINHNKIQAVFISHMDADHFGGLPMLIQTMELLRERKGLPLKIFIPPQACEQTKGYLRMMYLMNENLSFKLDLTPLGHGRIFENAGTCFSAHSNNHIKYRFQSRNDLSVPTDSFSFSITMPDKRRMVYTGDIGGVNDMDAFINETDLLFAELGHIEPKDLFAYLADKKVAKIVCLHIHPVWNDRVEEILSLSSKCPGKEVVIGHDGMEIDF